MVDARRGDFEGKVVGMCVGKAAKQCSVSYKGTRHPLVEGLGDSVPMVWLSIRRPFARDAVSLVGSSRQLCPAHLKHFLVPLRADSRLRFSSLHENNNHFFSSPVHPLS